MSAGVEKVNQRKWRAWCPDCTDGVNTNRQVDAHIWATAHNQEKHSA